MQLRKWSQAAEQYEAVLRLDASRVVERVNLTVAYQQLGRFDEAVEQARTLLQSQPDNPRVRACCENVIASRGAGAGRGN